MRKVLGVFLLVLVIAAGTVGCKKIINAIFPGLDVDIPEIVVEIPFIALPPGTPVPSGEMPLISMTKHFNLDSIVKAKTAGEFGAADVTSVKTQQIVFALSNPDQQNNFANFESARFTFSSNVNSTTQEIAALTFPDVYTPSVTYLAPSNTPELRQYLDGSELTFNVFGKIRRYTTKALTMSVKVTIRVK